MLSKARRTNPSNLATNRTHGHRQSLQLLITGPNYLQTESQRCAHFSYSQERRGISLVIQWLRLHLPVQGGSGLIPCWEAKISHSLGPKKPKNKTSSNTVRNSITTVKTGPHHKKKKLRKGKKSERVEKIIDIEDK